MDLLKALQQEPRFARISKSDQELLVTFMEILGKRQSAPEPTPLLKSLVGAHLRKADPDPEDLHVSTELTDLSIGYFQEVAAFGAASRGVLPVAQKNDLIRRWNRGDLYRDDAQERPPATESAGGAAGKDTVPYICKRYAWHHDIDDETLANDTVGDPVARGTKMVVQKMHIRREKIWSGKILVTGTWGIDLDGVDAGPTGPQFLRWNVANSTPRKDLTTNAQAIHGKTGFWPNVLVLTPPVLVQILLNAEVVDVFKYTVAGATPSLPALADALFALGQAPTPTILVCGGVQTTSAKGVADTFGYITGKHAWLGYIQDDPGLEVPSAYYVPSWENAIFGTNEMGVRIKEFEIEQLSVPSRIEGEIFFDVVITATDLGAFFETAVA